VKLSLLLATLAITHVTVIDPNGGAVQRDVNVVVRDQRIESVGTNAPPKDATIIDGRGKFLIPGLWDMHVHLSSTTSSALPILIANGVTSVRDMGSMLGEIDDWRARIAAGVLTGPRILRVGPILNGKSFNRFQMVAGTPDEARGVVRALKQVGVDFIKVHRRVPRDTYYAILDEAKKLGIDVVGHIPMTVTPEEASDAGQSTIEHAETIFEGTFSAALPNDAKLAEAVRHWRESDASTNLFKKFAANHNAFDPTLAPHFAIVTPSAERDQYIAASAKKEFPNPLPPELVAGEKELLPQFIEVVRQAHRAGVSIVAGTDTGGPRVPGFTLHDELALLVQAGLTPLEALQAATITAARVTHRDKDLGTIESGKLADLVLLDANPLDDVRNTTHINAVIVNGKLFKRADLDALLREGVALAARQ
jgi:imidazolonepropionase-like amidohydrolase